MSFWSNPNVQPKLSFKWFASFGLAGDAINTYCLRSFTKPSFEVGTSEYIWVNDVGYRPGILSWNPVEVTISDLEDMDENNTKKLYNMMRTAGYQSANVNRPQSAIEKKKATLSLGGDVRLVQVDSDGDTVDTWTMVNPFITQINFGQANYGADEIMTISLNLRYDYAVHEL